ncbi:ubiquitin carboxyl-terminal hydrolase 45-like isoform X2 [Argiope bruennichi]|uniref:ubiquitin carboxyl-terminal hydrolase 45-like isoform X2 n=1 Tax=Argiope bruennichi TaxID=94029 RepID=UPI0024941EAA|nr:ubiquitin carboxyl-terminal hydrolase 45-like isoform X2 [Argiope bruennichi]
MTKKKNNRQKRQKDVNDTSEEELNETPFQGKICPHIPRAVNLGRVKRVLKNAGNLSVCSGCLQNEPSEEAHVEVWLCLQCGYRGCGRLSPAKHGLQHYKTIHSDCHSLVLSSSSGIVWCYDCDDEIQLESSRNLKQSVEFILKMNTNNSNVVVAKNEKKISSNQPSLVETVLKEQNNIKNNEVEASPKQPEPKTENKNKKSVVPTKNCVKGLKNLGHTCYFNAVMQNLSQTKLLYHALEESCSPSYKWEIPELVVEDDIVVENPKEILKISLPKEFQFVHTFAEFLKRMNTHCQKSETINPDDLFRDLQKKSPQFQYFIQQDSHELLRQFLDGIRQDEVKRQKKAILRYFNIVNVNPEEIDEDTKKLVKAYGSYASHTIVDKIFGGLLISTVLCEECKMSSQVFEPFMDMSLPLFEEKPIRGRKSDQDENEEQVLNRTKKDYSKPSKHQEKKMKQMEKKEKKKLKRVQIKKPVELNGNSPEEVDTSNLPDTAVDNEEEIDENAEIDVESDEPSQLNNESTVLPLLKETLPNGDILSDDDSDSEKMELLEKTCEISHTIDKETGESIPVHKNFSPVKSGQVESILLFDDIELFLSDEEDIDGPVEHSEDASNSLETNNSNVAIEVESLDDSAVADLSNSIETVTISEVNSGLDERIHALSMQVKEVRIRRDSDRQESILSSSPNADDFESSKTVPGSDDSPDEKSTNDQEGDLSHNLTESETKEWILKSLSTLKPRKHMAALECSIDTCLSHFTKPELLTGNNKFRCENCSEIKRKKSGDKKAVVYSNASKQLLVFSPPAVLTLHLKRFQQIGFSLRKVNRFVEFPLTLDLTPYCSSACLILPHMATVKDEILYSLYGIVEHSGHLRSGHYTAYVKVSKRQLNQSFMCNLPLAQCNLEQLLRKFSKTNSSWENNSGEELNDERRWYYISDSVVREASESVVLKCQAYLLFYERIK